MPTPRSKLRLVMLQIREHATPMLQEQRCVIERCDVARNQIRFVNVATDSTFGWADVADAHAVLIGGAGAFSATETHHFTARLTDLVAELVARDRPVFGSCWGHQFLAAMLGSTVIKDPERGEIGSYEIDLTPAGVADPLTSALPPRFTVQLGHHDRVETLGPQWIELAASALCPYQAIRLTGKPVYGTQFHSEMNEDRFQERLEVYRSDYAPDADFFNRVIADLRPSAEADRLLARFLDLYA